MTVFRRIAVVLVGCLIVAGATLIWGFPKFWKPTLDAKESFQEFQALKRDCEERLKSLNEEAKPALETAKSQAELQQRMNSLREESLAIIDPAVPKAFEFVRPHSAEPAAVEPLAWILRYGDEATAKEAATLLIEKHLTNPQTLELARRAAGTNNRWVEPMLRAQLAAADLPASQRPHQMRALASRLQRLAEQAKEDKQKLALEEEAIRLFTELEDNYPDTQVGRGMTMGPLAKMALVEITQLGIGKTAPDIAGVDLDGVPFQLSDYRGKVVLVSFWGSWCGPCMNLIPHERALVEKYKAQPFALIGVNSDSDLDKLKPLLKQQQITWRSFWCGAEGPAGAIPQAWNVTNWPSMYLIDAAGTIRWKRSLGTPMEPILEELVATTAKRAQQK